MLKAISWIAILCLACLTACAEAQSGDDSGGSADELTGEPIGSGWSSECGAGQAAAAASGPAARAYCDAELLTWSRDDDAGEVLFRHARRESNCCAEAMVEVLRDGDTIRIVEREYLIYGWPPCGCTCVFDYDIKMNEAPKQTQPVELWIEDYQGELNLQWAGEIDFALAEGEVVLSEEPSSWCDSL